MILSQIDVPKIVDDFKSLRNLKPKSIIILGGSFDPPHLGHYEYAKELSKKADLVIVIPAAQNPLKSKSTEASAEDRVTMVEKLFAQEQNIIVSRCEILRVSVSGQPSYMIDTVEQALQELPGVKIAISVGSDCLADLHRWKKWEELFAKSEVVPLSRAGVAAVDWGKLVESLGEERVAKLKEQFILADIRAISSTELRDDLTKRYDRAWKNISREVQDYIIQKDLYL